MLVAPLPSHNFRLLVNCNILPAANDAKVEVLAVVVLDLRAKNLGRPFAKHPKFDI